MDLLLLSKAFVRCHNATKSCTRELIIYSIKTDVSLKFGDRLCVLLVFSYSIAQITLLELSRIYKNGLHGSQKAFRLQAKQECSIHICLTTKLICLNAFGTGHLLCD